jgi:hypothetical protein
MTDVVEPIAHQLDDFGTGLGLSSAHATLSPRGLWPFAQEFIARGVDVGEVVVKFFSTLTANILRIITGGQHHRVTAANAVPLSLGSVASGTTATTKLLLTNDTDGPFNAVQLFCRGFSATRGTHMAADAIRFTPTLADVRPHSSTVVTMHVDVPPHARAGGYVALVEVQGQPTAWIVATLDVL